MQSGSNKSQPQLVHHDRQRYEADQIKDTVAKRPSAITRRVERGQPHPPEHTTRPPTALRLKEPLLVKE